MEALGLDIRALAFQLGNFVLLLVILTKLLHKPLKQLMEKRQQEINEGLDNAAKARQQLEEAEAEREKMLAKADTDGRALLEEVKKRATALEATLTADAQEKSEKMLAKTREELGLERQQLVKELRGELATLVVTATEKVLASPIPDAEKRKQMEELVKEVSP